jgi:hypothetical protein
MRSSPQRTEGFYKAIDSFNLTIQAHQIPLLRKKKLIIDVPIWWNSTFLMIEQAYEYCDVREIFLPAGRTTSDSQLLGHKLFVSPQHPVSEICANRFGLEHSQVPH